MKQFVMKLLYVCIAVFLSSIAPMRVSAADFQADYDTQYAVSPSGTTIVTQNITLTNKQSNLYPKQYTISIDSEKIKNVIAYDQKGVITPKITQEGGTTHITVQFNEQVVGIDKKLVFNIRYENGDIARQLGNIWEVHVPGIENDDSLGEYTVTLQTPTSFPANAYMTPLPATGSRWTKEQLINGGINAAYGEFQSYVANLTYTLENDTLSSKTTTITIPADNAYQTISIDSITPKPKEMKKDEDGNWIASFELTSKQRVDVIAKLHVQTYNKPKSTYNETPSDVQKYLGSDRYWETQDSEIQKLGAQYKTPREIYDYVVTTLSYLKNDSSDAIRKGAVGALADPASSVCTEFTDLFIAVARAAGIPAREVIGYAYTTDTKLRPLLSGSDVLHAWPEYYDATKKQWIQIDPTWAHTTGGVNYFDAFDFNHIAFVIHGVSSETPYPAGSYKEGSIPRKNVSVTFAPVVQTTANASFRTTFLLPTNVNSGKNLVGSVQIENLGNVTAKTVNIIVDANPYTFHINQTEQAVPPFGILTVPIQIPIDDFTAREKGTINVSVNGETSSFTFSVTPMYWLLIPISVVAICLIFIIWWIFRKK